MSKNNCKQYVCSVCGHINEMGGDRPHPAKVMEAGFSHNDLDEILRSYPKPIQYKRRAKKLLVEMLAKDPDSKPRFLKALNNYKKSIEVSRTERRYIKSFPSFFEVWDYWENPPQEDQAESFADYMRKKGSR